MPIHTLSYKPLYLLLADHIDGMIREGVFPGGSFLPPLRTLMRRFSVSLATVRGAYAVLEKRGMIRRIRGAGVEVTYRSAPKDEPGGGEPVLDTAREIADLFDLRRILEPAAMDAAFDRMDREGMAKARAACRATDRQGVYDLDRFLHEQVAACCPNRHMKRALIDVMNRIEFYRELKFRSVDTEKVLGAGTVLAAVDAVAAGDRRRACAMLALHIEETRNVLLGSFAGSGGKEA